MGLYVGVDRSSPAAAFSPCFSEIVGKRPACCGRTGIAITFVRFDFWMIMSSSPGTIEIDVCFVSLETLNPYC